MSIVMIVRCLTIMISITTKFMIAIIMAIKIYVMMLMTIIIIIIEDEKSGVARWSVVGCPPHEMLTNQYHHD